MIKKDGDKVKECKTLITNIRHYKTFEDYLRKETLILPGVPTIECGVVVYRQWYSEEKEFGVLAIELRKLKNEL